MKRKRCTCGDASWIWRYPIVSHQESGGMSGTRRMVYIWNLKRHQKWASTYHADLIIGWIL